MGFLREIFWLSATFNFRITAMHIPGISNPVADAISRLRESMLLSKFCNVLLPHYNSNIATLLKCPLLFHMSVVSCSFLFLGTRESYLVRQLANEVFKYRPHTFVDSTKGTYRTHLDCYMRFCLYMGFQSIQAPSFNICLYAVFFGFWLDHFKRL